MAENENEIPAPQPLLPRCGFCGKDLIGLQVVQMTLPKPNSQTGMAFSLALCPNKDCRAVLPAAYAGEVEMEPPPNQSKIWKPS